MVFKKIAVINTRETWKVINSALGRNTKTTLINELSCGGQSYTDKKRSSR